MAKIKKDILHVQGIEVGIYTEDFRNEYISLTDIARYRNGDDPRFAIQNWMRNRNTIEFLGLWESLHNPNFNRVQFDTFKTEAGLNRFVMTPSKWIEQTGAVGIVSKAGRYGGGTYAHSDIAMEFASWISAEFKLYLMKDYRRLKYDENSRLSLSWNLNREISKLNYRVHTDAIQQNLLPPELTKEQQSYVYADEQSKDFGIVSTDIHNPSFLTIVTYQALLAAFCGHNDDESEDCQPDKEDGKEYAITNSSRFQMVMMHELYNYSTQKY